MIYRLVLKQVGTDDQMVLFCSHLGRNYSCNPKAIYEKMMEEEKDRNYKIVWAFKKKDTQIPGNPKVVRYGSLKYLYHLSKAKYWVFNAKMPYQFPKKKNQIYLQTWHGTPLKRLARDIESKSERFYRSQISKDEMTKSYVLDARRYDYMISPNAFSTEAFQSAFGLKREVLVETGYPRNDVLVNTSSEEIERIKEKHGIPQDKKILLYAPTWRDNHYDTTGYLFRLEVDFKKWKKTLGDDYFVIYKPHYLIYNTSNNSLDPDFGLDASSFEDINDLYLVSDILVTDYSSVFFDYGVLKRPMLFYMYDLEDYRDNLRGFYLDIYTELPGPIVTEEDALLEEIKKAGEDPEYRQKQIERFYEKYCSLSDGRSSEKIIELVFNDA
ncbi:MAG TPA: teichoic acid biosynthesis protein F, partial [Eubacteriaceae bacterium]|nr:teichoic acid biosynthesis protein F [Eubacteriaceae bacterium]